METLQKEKYKGYKIKVTHDEFDPRKDQDNLTKMVCFHKRYILGDKHEYNHGDYNGWDAMERSIKYRENVVVIAPLYLYDHSGITINTTGFNCPWDSGQVGFVFITKKEARKWFGWKRITKERKEKLKERLLSDVKEYDNYLTGMQYKFDIYKKKEWIEGYGCFDDDDKAMEEAKSIIDKWEKDEKEST